MSKCVLSSTMVAKDSSGHITSITRCVTHNWQFDGTANLQCPIGRIEEASDKAIEKIRKEHAGVGRQFG